jgi:membrane protein implicated in regulation of membrane protease activity
MLSRLALLILLLAPAQAFAMPAAVAAVAAWYAAATAATIIAVAQFAITVGMAIYGSAKQRRQERAARNEYNSKLQDRTITSVATEAPHRYVYGRAKVGSSIVAIFTSGDKDQYKHLVCVHAVHECDAIEEVYVAGKALGPLDAGGSVTSGDYCPTSTEIDSIVTTGTAASLPANALPDTVNVFFHEDQGEGAVVIPLAATVSNFTVSFDNPTGRQIWVQYNYTRSMPRVSVQKHLGTPTDGADTLLMAAAPDKWTANSVLRGFCYTVVTLDLNQPEFQGGIPSVEVLLRGKKVYDPRNGQTYWGQNPALAIYDYLTSEMCGVPAADIPLAQVMTAATVCDTSWGAIGARYTLNGTVTSEEGQAAVLEKMAQAMAGGIVSTTWEMFAGSYVAPILQLDQSDIVGSIAIAPGASDADIYNGVRGQYVGVDTQYVATDFKTYQNATYLAADGRDLWTNIDFPFTDSLQRVHNLARIYTEDQRNGYTVKAAFSLKAWGAKVGDRIGLTSALFGWDGKVFRVTDKSYSPSSMIELTLKEDAESIWDSADAVTVDATPNTSLPNPFAVAPLASITCQSGEDMLIRLQDGTVLSRILVTWPAASAKQIEVEWQLVGSGVWDRVVVNGDATSAYLSPVQDLMYYTVRARAVNPYVNTNASDWVYATHGVIGKTAPPPNVETFSITNGALSWAPVVAADLAGYLVRFQYGENRTWSNASALHEGIITQSPFRPELIPQGPCTLLIKAVDTTGRESVNAATIVANLGDVIVENVILTYDDQAAGFPGTKTNCAVVGGALLANDTGGLYWLDEDAPHYRAAEAANYWATISYAPLEYITQYVTQPDQVGSRLTLDTAVGTDGVTYWGADASAHFGADALGYWVAPLSYGIEFRYGTQGVFWGADGALFYPAQDSDLVWQTPTAWQPWPGSIEDVGESSIDFRITVQGGTQQGGVYGLAINFDVPDQSEELNDIAISATGTRLPITQSYRSIKNVQLTLQDNGSTAVTTKYADKATTGPMVCCYNAAGAKVAGIIDARIQGVKG